MDMIKECCNMLSKGGTNCKINKTAKFETVTY